MASPSSCFWEWVEGAIKCYGKIWAKILTKFCMNNSRLKSCNENSPQVMPEKQRKCNNGWEKQYRASERHRFVGWEVTWTLCSLAPTLGSVHRFLPYSIKYLSKGIISSLHLRITLSDFPLSLSRLATRFGSTQLMKRKTFEGREWFIAYWFLHLFYWFRFKMSSMLSVIFHPSSTSSCLYLNIICL